MTKDTTAPERMKIVRKSRLGVKYDLIDALENNPTIIMAGDDISAEAICAIEAAQARIVELEDALRRISEASNHYALTVNGPAAHLRYSHMSIRNLARAALQENKKPKRADEPQKGE